LVKGKLVFNDGRSKTGFIKIMDDSIDCNDPGSFSPGTDLVNLMKSNKSDVVYAENKPPEYLLFVPRFETFSGGRGLEPWQINFAKNKAQDLGPSADIKANFNVVVQEEIEQIPFKSIKSVIFLGARAGFHDSGDLPWVTRKDFDVWKSAKKYMTLYYPLAGLAHVLYVGVDPDYSQQELSFISQYYRGMRMESPGDKIGFDYVQHGCAGLDPIRSCIQNARNANQGILDEISKLSVHGGKIKSVFEEFKESNQLKLQFYDALLHYLDTGETEGLKEFIESKVKNLELRGKMLQAIGDGSDNSDEKARDLVAEKLTELALGDEMLSTFSEVIIKRTLQSLNIQEHMWGTE